MSSRFEWESDEELLWRSRLRLASKCDARLSATETRKYSLRFCGYLYLFAPGDCYPRLVVHEYPRGNFAVWINK